MDLNELLPSFPGANGVPLRWYWKRTVTPCREWFYEKQESDLSASHLGMCNFLPLTWVQCKHLNLKNIEGNSGNSVPLCVTVSAYSCHKF